MILRNDVANPEGPVLLPEGGWAIAEMDSGYISLISKDGGQKTELVNTGRPNGLALDKDGVLWVAESKEPALLSVGSDGELNVVSREVEGTRFLWPNDLCFGPDDFLYMTDSGVPLNDVVNMESPAQFYELDMNGKIFRIDPATGQGAIIDEDLGFVNGIAFGPGSKYLYINETTTGNIYRYEAIGNGDFGGRELFANVMRKAPSEHEAVAGPDGMAFGASGALYVAVLNQGDITVIAQDGSIKDHIDVDGTFPTNIAFGPNGTGAVLVTEGSKNQLLLLNGFEDGLPLHQGGDGIHTQE